MELFRKIVYKKKGDLVDIIAERIRCHPKTRRKEKREGKRKKTLKKKCQHIIVERIGCRLVALGQSFSLFIKTGRDRRTIHQDKWWSMVITETRIPRTKIQKPRSRTFPRRSK